MLHFKGTTFKFVYKDGRERTFTGSRGYCLDKYSAEEEDISGVYQLVNSRYTRISD